MRAGPNAVAAFLLVGLILFVPDARTAPSAQDLSAPFDHTGWPSLGQVPEADLSVTKTASPDPAISGWHLTYTIMVTNHGPSPSCGSTLTDVLPAGISVLFISPPCSGGFPCSMGGLAVGESATVTVSTIVDDQTIGSLSNTASIEGNELDPVPENNNAVVTTTVEQSADLQISKTAPEAVAAGEELVYTVTVSNAGPAVATGVVVDDQLRPQLTLVSISEPCSAGFPCALGELAVDDTVEFVIETIVKPDVIGGITALLNSASVSGNEPDLTPINTAHALTYIFGSSDVEVTMNDLPDPVAPGEELTLAVTLRNNGPSDTDDVILTADFSPDVTFISASPGCVWGPPCYVDYIEAGAVHEVTITTIVNPDTIETLVNTATAEPMWISDPDPSNNSDTESTSVVPFGLQAIPTLSFPGVAVLAFLLGLVGVIVVRRLMP